MSSAGTAASREARLLVLEDAFRAMAMAMEFGFLFDQLAPIAVDRISHFRIRPGSKLL